jgi:CRISPR-associated protein (TIGR03986 family)
MTQYIKAPFNFVPLNEKVFFPNWADQVSHDIPFSDGESGEIELELEAMTPIFVRNGHTKADAEAKNEDYVSFSKDADGNYFIPSTSVKGMIRNVLEIMSFGKMNQIANDRYGFRDLSNNKDYMPLFQGGKVHCGYMKKKNENELVIIDHGIPYRISHKEIDRKLLSKLSDFCASNEDLKNDSNRTARKKYHLLNEKTLEFSFNEDNEIERPKVDTRKFVKFDDKGILKGTLVLTGQPGERKKKFDYKKNKEVWTGKHYEFVFPSNELNEEAIPLNEDNDLRYKDFLFIHKDSSDWTNFRKKQFETKEPIPVFFVRDNNTGKILHFGLSYLYKIPYNKRIKDCLYDEHKKDKPDLTDLIFGNQFLKLKGRVQFSNAKLITGGIDEKIEPLMGSPKASYYPIYLQQNSTNGFLDDKFYQTYSSVKPLLKGWKRYPVHNKEVRTFQVDEKQKKNISPFVPLKKGSRFGFKIRFHNLKSEELGALLMAINLHESGEFHSIGFAKPYGYGKNKLIIKPGSLKNDNSFYFTKFKKSIEKEIPNWANSKQLNELNLLSTTQNNDNDLNYMTLSQFADAKSERKNNGNKLVLPYYSEFIKKNKPNEIIQHTPFKERFNSQKNSIPLEKDSLRKENIQPKIEVQPKMEVRPDWLKGIITGDKKVKLMDSFIEVALVIPIEKKNIPTKIGDNIWVKVKQLKKDGTINQVEFMSKE